MLIVDFETLAIMNEFIFGTVLRKEEFCKPLFEIILGVKIHALMY